MDPVNSRCRPHLFVLRIWLADPGDGKTEWRGDILDSASREKRYFREWDVLLEFAQAQVLAACSDDFPERQEKNQNCE
jgi:hypothetical protein